MVRSPEVTEDRVRMDTDHEVVTKLSGCSKKLNVAHVKHIKAPVHVYHLVLGPPLPTPG